MEFKNLNPMTHLRKIMPRPSKMASDVLDFGKIGQIDQDMLKNLGVMSTGLDDYVRQATMVQFERTRLYRELDKSLSHWMVGSAAELYADTVTNFSAMHGATVWVTSDSAKYTTELNKMLNRIAIEEKIFDWAWTTGAFGDLFVQVEGQPGLGVTMVQDDMHPIMLNRLDHNGVLVGFFPSNAQAVMGGSGVAASGPMTKTNRLVAPWEYIHFRILGSKRKRPMMNEPGAQEYRTINLLTPDSRVLTSHYGTSLLVNCLPSYKKLRLSEDSLLFARLTRGILKYIYKIKVNSTNVEAVSAIIDQYVGMLKKARAVDNRSAAPNFDTRFAPMTTLEDIILPVWGDEGDIQIDEIGGKTDIRWIADIEEFRNQLAASLRTPTSLLGAYTKEASGALGSQAIEKLDIRFARASRRLQRAIIDGTTRICQIHLAYLNMDPDPTLFKVNMAETSTAEEEQLRNSIDVAVDTIQKFFNIIDDISEGGEQMDKIELFNYFNQKLLKLGDLDLRMYVKKNSMVEQLVEYANGQDLKPDVVEFIQRMDNYKAKGSLKESNYQAYLKGSKHFKYSNMDLRAWTPIKENKWKSKFETVTVKTEVSMVETQEETGQSVTPQFNGNDVTVMASVMNAADKGIGLRELAESNPRKGS